MARESSSAQVIEQAPSTQVTEVAEESTERPMKIAPGVAVRVGGVAGVATSFPEDGKVIVETEDGKILPYDESEVEVVGETTETIGTTETTMSDGSNEPDGTNGSNDAKESQSTASPLGAIPVDAKGEPMYESAPVEATIADIYNDPDLDEDEADAFVQAKIDGATKRIAQLEKKKPKMGESKVAFKEAKAKWREQLEAEQASLAYWQGVQEARAKESTPSPSTPQSNGQPPYQSRGAITPPISQGETRGELGSTPSSQGDTSPIDAQPGGELDANGGMGEIGEISTEAEGDDVSERDSKVDKDTNVAEEGSVTEGTVEEETPIEEKQTQEETGELTTSPLQDSSQSQTSGGLSEDLTEVVGETDKLLAERKRAMEAWLQAEEGADKDAKWGDYSQAIDALESYAMGLNDEQLATLQSHYGKGEVREIDDEISRRDEIKVKNAQYDELLSKQYPIERKERKGTGKLEDALSKDATRPVMTGVYHDEDGYAVATDAKVLVADKREYNGRKKGKIIGKDGKEIPGNFPKWKLVIPAETEALPIDLQDLSGFIGGVKAKLKENGIKPKDYGKAVIMIKTGSGTIVYYPVDALETWLNGAMRLGATGSDVGVSERNGFIVAKTKNGVAMLASKAGLAYNDTGIVYEVNASPSTPQSRSDSSPKGRGALEKQVGGGVMENATEAQRLATDAVITSLEASGIEVVEASDAMAEAVMGMGGVEMSAKKKRALETVSVQETEHQQTVISSADGAKVLNNLDNLQKEYEESPKTNEKTFIGEVAKAIGAERKGSRSQYVTFETKNGKVVTIRLSNHNATVSNFDNNGEADGISIVVSAKGNNGMTNDGDAHVVEHYYDAIKLRRAEGKPLADIVRSIKQALYSGEFTDTTGLAERQEVNLNEVETLRTPQGVVYGWTDGKKVYLTKEGMNPETPIHEYTHLWARAMMQGNAEGWQSVKDLLRGTPVWNEVMSDANYADIHGDEDAVASECLSRLSGRENAKRMEAEARKMIDEAKGVFAKADAVTLVERMKKALQEFWDWVGKNLFDIKNFGSIEEVTDRVLYDLIHNSQFIMHNSELPGIEKQIIGESGASALDKADEATHRMDNLGVAREMEAEGSLEADGLLFRDGDVFYSNAEEAVRNIKQEKATPEQWLAMIQKNGGLKAGEDKWLGLSDWLTEKGKSKDERGKSLVLTKQEVLDYINQNKIVIEEVNYGTDEALSSIQSEFDELTEALGGYGEAYDEMANRYGNDFKTAIWYDEVGQLHFEDGYEDYGNYISDYHRINSTRLDYTTEGLENKREIALVVPTVDPYNASDEVHFGDAGDGRAVAWVRFGETTDENGNRVLVIDEIQSKRHQDGREKGYRDADAPNRVEDARKAVAEAEREFSDFRNAMQEKYDYNSLVQGSAEERKEGRKAWRGKFTPEEMIKYDQLHDATIDARNALEEARQSQNRVPDAPFEKNWHELAMKRMLRYAAENGYDKVAWTTGEQQAERYDIGKAVDSIESIPYKAPGSEDVEWWDVGINAGSSSMDLRIDANGTILQGGTAEMNLSGKQLSEVIGKELANDILLSKENTTLSGEGLRIGGEGMKGFYDKMLPSFMNKYGKKWGVKVGEVELPEVGEDGLTMHSIDVTDAMRESVMEGQPMFREGDGEMNDAEVSMANDPIAKVMGRSQRTKAQQAKFAERERKAMRNRVSELAEKMGISDRVTVVSSEEIVDSSARKARAKGWFDTRTGRIVINISNHTSVADVERTLLHEAVAHYGLRQLFGKQFDTFLDNVYLHADAEVRAQIVELAKKHGWEFIDDTILAALGGKITRDLPPSLAQKVRTATEEYLAGLAEDTNFEYLEYQTSFWMKIKRFFMDMLESIGWDYKGPELSDNELRYLLWRSYENMVNPGRHRSILGKAEDVAKQYELGVGNYSADAESMSQVAEEGEKAEPQPIGNGAFGAIYTQFRGKAKEAIAFLMRKQSGEAIGALSHPEIGEIDLVWGKEGTSHSDGYGLAKLVKYHPEVLDNLQEILSGMNVVKRSPNRVQLESNTHKASVRLTWDNQRKTWLLTAFEKKETPETTISSTGVDNSPKGLLDDTAPQQSSSVSADKVNNNNSEKQENNESNGSNGSSNAERDSDEGILFRDGESDGTREEYDRRVRRPNRSGSVGKWDNLGWRMKEAYQDSMLSLKELQDVVAKKYGLKEIPSWMNAYLQENLMSSRNKAASDAYMRDFYNPMMKEVQALIKKGVKYKDLVNYMIAKHGLERNVVMAERDAKRAADEAVKEIQNSLDKELNKYKKANELFNQQLQDFESNSHEGNLVLGEPSPILEACGIDVSSVFITPKTLKAHLDKHGLTINDIKDLPKALLSPLMVYEWGTTAKSMIVITHIPRGEQRITIAIKLERGGKRVEVNEIASIHGKDSARFIDEMIKSRRGGLSSGLKYVDKENALNWLGIVPPKGTAPRTQQERIANIIEKFENPTTKIQKIQDAIRLEKAKFDGVLKNLPLSEANKWYDTRKKNT